MARTPPEYGKWIDWVIHVKFSDTKALSKSGVKARRSSILAG